MWVSGRGPTKNPRTQRGSIDPSFRPSTLPVSPLDDKKKNNMHKKFLIIGLLVTFTLSGSVYVYTRPSISATDLRYPDPASCQQSWLNEMDLMQTAWSNHLEQLTDEEQPTSELVGDAFESLRTYQCWLQYLCHTVRISGIYSPREAASLQLKSGIPTIPGCAPLRDIEIPGVTLSYMPRCTAQEGKTPEDISTLNYNACREDYLRQFADTKEAKESGETGKPEGPEGVYNKSVAFIALESVLRQNAYHKKSMIMTKKLNGILEQMHSLEISVVLMGDLMKQLSTKITCFPNKCD